MFCSSHDDGELVFGVDSDLVELGSFFFEMLFLDDPPSMSFFLR